MTREEIQYNWVPCEIEITEEMRRVAQEQWTEMMKAYEQFKRQTSPIDRNRIINIGVL